MWKESVGIVCNCMPNVDNALCSTNVRNHKNINRVVFLFVFLLPGGHATHFNMLNKVNTVFSKC